MKFRIVVQARAVLVAGFFLLSGPLLAQQAILQGGAWKPGHAPMYKGQGSSQPVVVDSGPAGGGGVGVGLSELLITATGTGTAPYAGQGTGPFGTDICNYDAPITNPSGAHFLCLSANANGGGLLAYGAIGAASPLPFSLNLNGTQYEFPFVLSGIVGPSSSTVGDAPTWANGQGTLLADGGAPPAFGTPTVITLKALPVVGRGGGLAVKVSGYYAPGDMPAGTYALSTSQCVLNAGAGDGGSQLPSSTSGYCWNLVNQPNYSPKQFGAVDGSNTNSITGSVTGSSTSVTLSGAGDFANGQPIAIVGAGSTYTQAAPTALAAAGRGSTGATSYFYTVAAIDNGLGIGAAVGTVNTTNSTLGTPLATDSATLTPAFTFTGAISGTILTVSATTGTMAIGQKIWSDTGNLAFSTRITALISGSGGTGTYRVASGDPLVSSQSIGAETMYAGTPGVYNDVSWTAPGSPPLAYVIYAGSATNNMVCVAVVAAGSPNGTRWRDYGPNHYQNCPSWIPASPLVQAQNDVLQSTILSGAGTTSLILAGQAAHTVSGSIFFHDSTASLQKLAALGQPIVSDCSQYNLLGGINIVGSGFSGGGQDCTVLKTYGGGNAVTQTASSTYLQNLTFDESQKVAGFALSVQASRTRDRDIYISNPYNMVELTAIGNSSLNNFFENVLDSIGFLRGDYGMWAHTDTTHVIQNMMVYNFSTGVTTTAYSFLQDGAVNGTRARLINTQAGPHEFIVQNSVGAAVGSNFGMFDDTGTNFSWDDNTALLNSANGYIFKRFYCQGQKGGMGPAIYVGPTVGPETFSMGTQIFGADLDGIEYHGQSGNSDSTLMVYSNSQVGTGISSKVHVAADATNGQTWLLASGDRFVGASTVPLERYGVKIESGFAGGIFSGFPLVVTTTAGGGTDIAVCDNTGVYGMVMVNGTLSPGTCANQVVANTAAVTYTAASMVPTVYGQAASIYRSAESNDRTDTTATASAMITLIPNHQAGSAFNFRLFNLGNHIITLGGGTGVTIGGTATTAANSVHNFQCSIDSGGTTVTCTG